MGQKKLKKYIIPLILIISLTALVFYIAIYSGEDSNNAKTEDSINLPEDPVMLEEEEFDIVQERLSFSDIRIRDLSIEELSDSTIEGIFKIVNNSENYIGNLWYTTELYIDLGENTNLINSFSTPFEIMRNQEKKVSFTHNLPSRLPKGNYSIIFKVSNRTGNSSGFAFESLGELGLTDAPFLIFEPNNSYIYSSEEKLSLTTSTTFSPNEEPKLKLQFTNLSDSNISGYADVKVFERNELFKSEPVVTKQVPNINFSSLQTKDIELTLPSLDKPESYVAIIRIKDNNDNVISSKLEVNYIVGGEIVNIVESSIKEDGDSYIIDYFIRGSSDGAMLPEATLLVEIFDTYTNELISEDEISFSTNFSTEKVEYAFSLSEDITNIKVVAQIYAYDDLLDEKETVYNLKKNAENNR